MRTDESVFGWCKSRYGLTFEESKCEVAAVTVLGWPKLCEVVVESRAEALAAGKSEMMDVCWI